MCLGIHSIFCSIIEKDDERDFMWCDNKQCVIVGKIFFVEKNEQTYAWAERNFLCMIIAHSVWTIMFTWSAVVKK